MAARFVSSVSTMRQARGCCSRYFLTVFFDSATSIASTISPLPTNSLSIFSTSASSFRQYEHQVVQNSSKTTLPFTDSLLKLSPARVFARKRGAGSFSSSPAKAHTAVRSNTTSAQCLLVRMARNHTTREQNLSGCGDPHRLTVLRGSPRCDRNLVGRKMTPGLNLSMQECPIQFLYELYKFLWVLLTAGRFGKYSPISHLGFHWFTSVARSI